MDQPRPVAIVTGGGRNIGKAIALRLARFGHDVVVAGPDLPELEAVAAELTEAGRRALAVAADVRDEAQVAAMAARALEHFGRADVLVNNAGVIGPTAPAAEVSKADWDDVLAVNLTGAFLCAKAVLPAMVSQGSGRIINISSVAGKIAYALRSPYAVSKWGLIGLTLTLAKEYAAHGILVNAVCPGPVEGERMRRVIERRAAEQRMTYEEAEETYLRAMALGRFVREEEVAVAVSYLASPAAGGVTGTTLDVTGGYGL